jgi:hypothetical protein
MDQPGYQVHSQNSYQGRHLRRSKLRRSVIIINNKSTEIRPRKAMARVYQAYILDH